MYKLETNKKIVSVKTSTKDAEIGDLMIITEDCSYKDHIILKVYSDDVTNVSLISLTDPGITWGNPDFEVRFLEPGEVITLIVQ